MRTYIFFLLASLPATLLAQREQHGGPERHNRFFQNRQYTLGGGLELNIPVGDFDRVWARNFIGFGADFTYPMRRLPFDAGFGFSYAVMGKKNASANVQTATQGLQSAELTVKSKLYSYMGRLRLRPFSGRISPYAEGLLGLRQFTTTSNVDLENSALADLSERRANAWTGCYGWALGTLVTFGAKSQLYAQGRVEKLWGGRVSYVDSGSISIASNGEVNYGTLSSATDMLTIRLGIGVKF
ncbi:MAG: hypothetical protein IT230_02955 [Flavobacteriales bacterium]|nr:hypothetical protein [Flavobacteriales bacterium]